MMKFGPVAIAVGLSVALGAMLLFIPPMISFVALLLWSFISSGHLLIDGYVRAITAVIFASVSLWHLAVIFPAFWGRSDLVQYAEYMVQAEFYVTAILVAAGALLAGVGVRRLLKARQRSLSNHAV